MFDQAMEKTGGDKYSIDHDCESETVVQKQSVSYSSIKIYSCSTVFYSFLSLIAIASMVLSIELLWRNDVHVRGRIMVNGKFFTVKQFSIERKKVVRPKTQ